MKGTIASLVLVAAELTICLISTKWGSVEVNDNEICFKNLFVRFNTSSARHQNLHVGPLYASHTLKSDKSSEYFPSDHAKTETILIITGIGLIIFSAICLSSIEFCLKKSFVNQYRIWFHFANVIMLTISIVVLVVGFYLLQHVLKHPLNGIAALGFFIGILFLVMLATHSAITFWADIWQMREKQKEKVAT